MNTILTNTLDWITSARRARKREKEVGNDVRFTEGRNVSEATYRVLAKLLKHGNTVPSRNGTTLEFTPHTVTLEGGGSMFTVLPRRKNNPMATVAEVLWVWAGRNDVDSLSRWLPRAKDYSDDGRTWRAGYGPRLRAWEKRNGAYLDQLELTLNRLRKDPETRQAVMVIADPDADSIEKTLDRPCNLVLNFLSRDGKLSMHTYLRSNDIIFGVCINFAEWIFVWRYLAEQLGMELGEYHHTATSLHLYDWMFGRAREVVQSYVPVPDFRLPAGYYGDVSPAALRYACNEVYESGGIGVVDRPGTPRVLVDYSNALYSENALVEGDARLFINLLQPIRDANLKLSMLEFGQRRLKYPLWIFQDVAGLFPDADDFSAATRYLAAAHRRERQASRPE